MKVSRNKINNNNNKSIYNNNFFSNYPECMEIVCLQYDIEAKSIVIMNRMFIVVYI